MQICVLGPVTVRDDGVELDLGPARQRALLAVLVAAAGRAVGVDQLVAELWGQSAPPKVMASLQVHVANLRRILEPHRAPRTRPSRLVTRPPGYALVLDDLDLDAVRFGREAAEGRALLGADPRSAARTLEAALSLWHGEAYAGLTDDSDHLTAEAARLDELRGGAVEDLAQARTDTGDHARAVAELEPYVRAHPLRERAWGLLALALYRAQRQGEALEALRRARTHLAEELGVDPSPELRALEAAVLAQDPELAAPAGPAPDAGTSGVPAQEPLAASMPLGRSAAVAEIGAALAGAVRGRGRIVTVSGEPGIGKSAVAAAALDLARSRGAVTGWGSWEEEGGAEALHPWVDALAGLVDTSAPDQLRTLLGAQADELAPLVPALRDRPRPADDAVDVETAGLRLAGALATLIGAMAEGRGALLVLDDVHWADADSLRLLRRLAPAVAELPLVLVLTSRAAEADLTEDVVATAAVIARHDPLRVPLTGLSEDDVAALLQERFGTPPDRELVRAVAERTDGNPFFIGEVVRLLGSGAARADEVAELDVPDGVRDVVRRRLSLLSEAARDVLGVAAIAGRRFAVDVVEDVVARGRDELDDALDLALLHDLLRADDEPGSLRFSHALVREAVYAQVPPHRRLRLHGGVAQSLERLRIGRVDEHLAELVLHYQLAGPQHARACWTYAARAAVAADARGAHDETARLYEVALEALRLDPQSTTADEAVLLTGLGRVRRRQAAVAEGWPLLARAARLTLDAGDPVSAASTALVISEGTLWTWRGHGEVDREAIALWQRLLDAVPAGHGGLRARVMAALALELFHDPTEIARSVALGEDAVLLAREQGTDLDLLRVLQMVHIVLERPDLFERRVALGEEQVEVALRLGRDLAHALCQRGTDRFEAGRIAAAEADLQRAWDLGTAEHDVTIMLVSGWARALFPVARGDLVEGARRTAEVSELQQSASMTGEVVGEAQRLLHAYWAGRLGEVEPGLREAARHNDGLHDIHVLSVLAASGVERARQAAGSWSAQPAIPFDYLWLALTTVRSAVWCALGDQRAVAELRTTLSPYAGRWAIAGGSAVFDGIVDESLGALALAAGDHEEATDRLLVAVEAYQSRGLWALLARAHRRLAASLRLRDPDDPGAASADARADELAAAHGLGV